MCWVETRLHNTIFTHSEMYQICLEKGISSSSLVSSGLINLIALLDKLVLSSYCRGNIYKNISPIDINYIDYVKVMNYMLLAQL